jgi:hypothetical protein
LLVYFTGSGAYFVSALLKKEVVSRVKVLETITVSARVVFENIILVWDWNSSSGKYNRQALHDIAQNISGDFFVYQ